MNAGTDRFSGDAETTVDDVFDPGVSSRWRKRQPEKPGEFDRQHN